MKRISLLLGFLMLAAILGGCAGPWTRVEKPLAASPGNTFTVELPVGWVRASVMGDRIIVTRDGPGVQAIEIAFVRHEDSFKSIDKESSPAMLPAELAELVIAEARNEELTKNLEVVENAPASIAGNSGFRLHVRFRNAGGLRVERMVYGFADASGFYRATYQAPSLHYFSRDLAAFETVVHSLRLSET